MTRLLLSAGLLTLALWGGQAVATLMHDARQMGAERIAP